MGSLAYETPRGEAKLADQTVLTWNLTNWITVVLMAAVGFGVLAIVLNLWSKRQAAQGQ